MGCTANICGTCANWEEFQDGVLSGKSEPLNKSLKQPLSVIFQNLIKSSSIVGSKMAVESSDKSLTFDQLEDFSTALARDIRDRIGCTYTNHNYDGDNIIAIIVPNTERAIVLIMAILKTGAAYLPLDEDYPEALLLSIINKFKPILIIADDNGPIYNKYDPSKFSSSCPMLSLNELWVDMEVAAPHADPKRRISIKPKIMDVFTKEEPSIVAEKFPAVLIHTGGFQGEVLGVRINHLSIVNHCNFEWNKLNMKQSQSCSLLTHISQADSIPQIFAPLLKGCTLHIFHSSDLKDMSHFLRGVATKNVNRLVIPCYYFYDLLNAVENLGTREIVASLRCVKYVVCRSGQIQTADAILFFKMFKSTPLCNCIGGPETTGDFIFETFTSVKDFKRKKIMDRPTLGKVMDNTKVYVLNDHLGIISDGHQGELCISGMCLGLGSVGQEDSEVKKCLFVKNPHAVENGYETLFRSGQYGRIVLGQDGKRRLCPEGREDRLIKQKGHQFRTEDLQPFLLELKFVTNSLVYILNNGKASQKLIAILVVNDGINLSSIPGPTEIERILREKLPEWSIPADFMITSSTKMPRHYYKEICPCCLIQEYKEQREPKSDVWEDSLMLTGDKHEATVTLVKAIYKMTSIPLETIIANLKNNFYSIGGNSLNTIPLLVYLNKKGYAISLKDFYTKSTLADLINLMMTKKSQVDEAEQDIPSSTEDQLEFGQNLPVKRNFHIMLEMKDTYIVEIMKKRHKNAVISIISKGYSEKSLLASYNMLQKKDLEYFLEETYQNIVEDKTSLVVIKKSSKQVVAAAICQDFFKLVDTTKANGTLFNIIEFFHEVKGNILLFLPHRQGETLEITWMSTHHALSPKENVKLITMLHTEIIKLAKPSYSGVFLTALNMLQRSLCLNVFGYDIFEDFQINKYQEDDGSKPFHLANDTVACAAMYTSLNDPKPPSVATSSTVIDPVAYFKNAGRRSINQVKYYHKED